MTLLNKTQNLSKGYIKELVFDLYYNVWNKEEMCKRTKQYIEEYINNTQRIREIEYKTPFEFKDGYRQFIIIRTNAHK